MALAARSGSFNNCDAGAACTKTTQVSCVTTNVGGTGFNFHLMALYDGDSLNTSYIGEVGPSC